MFIDDGYTKLNNIDFDMFKHYSYSHLYVECSQLNQIADWHIIYSIKMSKIIEIARHI